MMTHINSPISIWRLAQSHTLGPQVSVLLALIYKINRIIYRAIANPASCYEFNFPISIICISRLEIISWFQDPLLCALEICKTIFYRQLIEIHSWTKQSPSARHFLRFSASRIHIHIHFYICQKSQMTESNLICWHNC